MESLRDSQLNPITVAALLGRMMTLQYPQYNFSGDVKVSETERKLAKQMFEIMINMIADTMEILETEAAIRYYQETNSALEGQLLLQKQESTDTMEILETEAAIRYYQETNSALEEQLLLQKQESIRKSNLKIKEEAKEKDKVVNQMSGSGSQNTVTTVTVIKPELEVPKKPNKNLDNTKSNNELLIGRTNSVASSITGNNSSSSTDCTPKQDSPVSSLVSDHIIKQEVEEFHVSNINLQGNYHSKTSSKEKSLDKSLSQKDSGDSQNISDKGISASSAANVPDKVMKTVPISKQLETEERNLNSIEAHLPIVLQCLTARPKLKTTVETAKIVTVPEVQKSSMRRDLVVESASKDSEIPILKKNVEETETLLLIDEDIICLDDSDDEEERAKQIRPPSDSVSSHLSVIFKAQANSKGKRVPGPVMNVDSCKKSRLHAEKMQTDEGIKAEAKIKSVQNALKLENYTLEEFTRVRKENRKVLGADLRRWATIRASVYNDFEYKIGDEWVKYFTKKFNIKYDKTIGSLVFGGDKQPIGALPTKEKFSKNK